MYSYLSASFSYSKPQHARKKPIVKNASASRPTSSPGGLLWWKTSWRYSFLFKLFYHTLAFAYPIFFSCSCLTVITGCYRRQTRSEAISVHLYTYSLVQNHNSYQVGLYYTQLHKHTREHTLVLWCRLPLSAAHGMETGTRIKAQEKCELVLGSSSSSSGAWPTAKCAVPTRSRRPTANGRLLSVRWVV